MSRRAPILVALPSGLIVSGVATWAARLVSALAERGRVCGLVLHAAPPGHAPLRMDLHPAVRVFDLSILPRFEGMVAGACTPAEIDAARRAWVSAYHDAARVLARDSRGGEGASDAGRVVLSPNLHADCYATCVEVARRDPGLVRLVGWQHNDIEYDRRVLAHYEPALAEIVGVSEHIVSMLRGMLRASRVSSVAYGVEVPERPPVREPLLGGRGGSRGSRAVRLLYTGRLDHYQKRILALASMSGALRDMGVEHELTIMGDGPARADLERQIAQTHGLGGEGMASGGRGGAGARSAEGACDADRRSRGSVVLAGDRRNDGEAWPDRSPIRLTGPATPERVREALREHDAFVLASRFEGLSVSMLEALAAGCVPIVARVASGALQAVEAGVTGLVADVEPAADEETVGRALAGQVARLVALDVPALSRRAWESARDRFSIQRHAALAAAVLDRVAAAPSVSWPADRPVWFGDVGGSIPGDARDRLGRVLDALAGRRVVVHGTGLHTRLLLAELLRRPAQVVGFTDDDRQRHGQSLAGLPVVPPESAGALGATDVVISTWMHEGAVWAARGVYERRGLRVHRLYAGAERDPA